MSAPATEQLTLQERAAAVLMAVQNERDQEEERAQRQAAAERRSALVRALQSALDVRIPELQEGSTVEIEGLTFTVLDTRDGFHGGRRWTLHLFREGCARCGRPGWVEIHGLYDLGVQLHTPRWSHPYGACPDDEPEEEPLQLERPPANALPSRPTPAEQLVDLIRSIALDALGQEA